MIELAEPDTDTDANGAIFEARIDADGVQINDAYYTYEQIQMAMAACRTLATAYAQAEANEGAGMDWSDMDDAWGFAQHALPEEELTAIRQAAERAAGNDEDIDLVGAIVTAPGKSLIETVATARKTPIIQVVAAEQGIPVVDIKRPDDTEGGTCD